MTNLDFFAAMNHIDEDIIAETLPESHAAMIGKPARRRRHPFRALSRPTDTRWGIAASCALVSLAVLVGAFLAGRSGGTDVPPPHSGIASEHLTANAPEQLLDATLESLTAEEAEPLLDISLPSEPSGVAAEAEVETETETETVFAPELTSIHNGRAKEP